MPNALTKQAAARAAESASMAPTVGTRNFRPQEGSCGLSKMAWKVSHSETKSIERWQCRDGSATDKERERCLRHPMDEAAEMLHVALAGRGEHRPRTEEQ